MTIKDTLDRIEVMREMFPKCFYCDHTLDPNAPLVDFVKVADRDRLAHRDCLAAQAEEPA